MRLTDDHRGWLRRPEHACMPAWDMIGLFLRDFQLDGPTAGDLLAQWIKEVWSVPIDLRGIAHQAPILGKR